MTRTRRRWMPLLVCALAALLPCLGRVRAEPPAGDKYALLVGVHQYDKNELRDLPYAEADMTALADVLRQAGYKRVVLMTQSEGAKEARFLPEAAKIRATLKGMLEDLGPDESVLVAFAGHGVQYKDEDDNYFCPMDAKLADKTTLVSLSEVYKDLEKCGAGTRLLLADCCRNDPRSDNARAVDRVKLESVTRPQRALPPGGVAAFFSCSAGEKAYEDSGIKHGVFFHFIIEGLQGKADQDGDGKVDLDELVGYTKKQVRDFVKDTYGDDVRQMPELVGKTHGQVMLAGVAKGGAPLFNGKDLTGWQVVGDKEEVWTVEDGLLVTHNGSGYGWLLTDKEYADVEVRLDFKMSAAANSGVGLRAPLTNDVSHQGMEIQLLDDGWYLNPSNYNKRIAPVNLTGADPGASPAPSKDVLKPIGEWNTVHVTAKGRRVVVELNGVKTLDANLDDYAEAAENKFPGLKRDKGRLGLQGSASRVAFRNIRFKDLSPATDRSDAGSPVKP